ncbi:glycerol-3-phosphate 1-O-acyltransferase PlsY [Leptolyngbya sp. NIES-2104]|uniref:glycerol-3-phosphate 1-O-acyltransferase PlsY n=1 Tax=Leptolyngbya sp. NIES-2104 TaxID=1552121 RepID=UPI0006EC89F2|nr:glycerol-3-phosphate 1-O-acyltransferase PlsY [Leptolyngbya sp. NIES-2104]GAP95564.1 acyl-phosphate:glycerol-3-phosphate O-acyltransferase PlsY [Leptolyngbya sp. NIES-2104]
MLPWFINNALLLIVAYLLGSIPTGYLAGRLLKGIDIREAGSGSTGATNVLRTIGKIPALIVLLIDIGKGALAIAAVNYAFTYLPGWLYFSKIVGLNFAIWQPVMVTLAGLAALFGHSKSIWLGFSGGKSVATSLGILLAMNWMVALSTVGVFALSLGITRIVSISSIAGAVSVIAFMVLFAQPLPYLLFAIAGGGYVIWRHRSNIQRLIEGTEPKLGQKLEEPEAS